MTYLSRNYFILFTMAFVMSSCGAKKPPEKTEEEVIIVRTRPVSSENYAATLDYSGLMASTSEAKLSFKIAGIISKIYVKEGDHVSKGQLLATLNKTEINAQVQQASAGLEKADQLAGFPHHRHRADTVSFHQLLRVIEGGVWLDKEPRRDGTHDVASAREVPAFTWQRL